MGPVWLRLARWTAVVFLGVLFQASAYAHKPSDSYLGLMIQGSEVSGQWDIALRDLDYALGLDSNDDGAITWDELRTRERHIAAYAFARLRLISRGEGCPIKSTGLMVDHHSDGGYAVLRFSAACVGKIGTLTTEYRLFFDLDPQHRGLAKVAANGTTFTTVFSPERWNLQFEVGVATPMRQFLAFVGEGISHIWIGIDHLLFLLALLLPSMLVRTPEGWKPVAKSRDALVSVIWIVTSFTVAHSITLSLAALQVVSLPSRWVETTIAASVMLAALNNLLPVVQSRLWVVAFVFGLIHGFGFASVLLDMGLPRNALVLSLFGFNLGVELGQITVVASYFAIACLLRTTRLYSRLVMPGGSAVIALIALGWMLERALDIKLFP